MAVGARHQGQGSGHFWGAGVRGVGDTIVDETDADEAEDTDVTDGFGPLEFQEFLEGQGVVSDMQFDAYDLDADGVLSEDEYNEMVQDLGVEEGEVLHDTEDALTVDD